MNGPRKKRAGTNLLEREACAARSNGQFEEIHEQRCA